MKEAKDILRIAGLVFLTIFVIVVGGHLLMAAVGITLAVFGLAVFLIKVAIGIAIIYLILVGIRALLR